MTFKAPVVVKDQTIIEWLSKAEAEMKNTLALLLGEALAELQALHDAGMDRAAYLAWIDKFPAQLVQLSAQILWTQNTEKAFLALVSAPGAVADVLKGVEATLATLANSVMSDVQATKRVKYEQLITELVHERDVLRKLIKGKTATSKDFAWLYEMRFYFNARAEAPVKRLTVQMANAAFIYGFEYLGVGERLVQTPLTDRCYLTLTQALESRLGGSPFGPAGTGKTETVKALGNQLGRFVLVFCCDENFDYQAMSRIFVGLCQCGAWGCFDEFNRLEERILSACSQQIQTIQVRRSSLTQTLESRLVVCQNTPTRTSSYIAHHTAPHAPIRWR